MQAIDNHFIVSVWTKLFSNIKYHNYATKKKSY
jgi:hypothetical protein